MVLAAGAGHEPPPLGDQPCNTHLLLLSTHLLLSPSSLLSCGGCGAFSVGRWCVGWRSVPVALRSLLLALARLAQPASGSSRFSSA